MKEVRERGLCSDRRRRDAVVEAEAQANQEVLLRIRHCKARAMGRDCGRHRPIASGTEMVMDLGRMRGIGTRGLARLHVNVLEMMVRVKVHGRMLGTGRTVRVIQLASGVDSERGAPGRLPGNSPDFVVEELETLPGNSPDSVVEELETLPGTCPDFALEELAKLL